MLFASGKHQTAVAFPIKAVFCKPTDDETSATRDNHNAVQASAQVLISVPKRNLRHAVDRNRVKRQIREAYRRNKINEPLLVAFIWMDNRLWHTQKVDHALARLTDKILSAIH